jgi:transposase
MASARRIKRKTKRVRGGGQLDLGLGVAAEARRTKDATSEKGARRVLFNDPDPRELFIGDQRLSEFLKQMGFEEVFALRELLRSLDLTAIEEKYIGGGRRPYHPAGMLGLIMLGIMEGKCSLRELERVGRSDVRSWWLTGGVMPDYSVICRFINGNAEMLTEEFFEQLTRQVLKRTSSSGASVAVDGTVIQAAASRFKTIKREAAEQAAAEARAKAKRNPDDEKQAKRAEEAERVAEASRERSAEREKKHRKNTDAPVCPSEPEAVVQPLKTKAIAPGYKGSVAANDDRIITANAVHPTSETAVVPSLVEQTERVTEQRVEEILEDAGYHCNDLLNHAVENDINILCPQGRSDSDEVSWEKKSSKLFLKNRFRFDERNDVYICPAGQRLERDHQYKGNENNPSYVQYRCAACGDCPMHARCTKAPYRAIKRYEEDDLKEAMREVMKQPGARRRYKQRQAMVEPVFGEKKYIQRLQRFHRRGLRKVTLEYSLHCSAHNLRRYVHLCARRTCMAGENSADAATNGLCIAFMGLFFIICELLLGRRKSSHPALYAV